MREIHHVSLDIAGALKWKKNLRGLICEDNGAEWTDKMVRNYFKECLAKGWKLLPFGKECEGYSHETGCPGHPIEDEK
jgi:hypothetical protein